MREKQNLFPDAFACQSIDEDFGPLMDWLDAHPDRDVSEFDGWREVFPDSSPLQELFDEYRQSRQPTTGKTKG